MSGAIAVFVKTPGFSPVKTRLAAAIGKENAEIFYKLSLKATEEVILKTDLTPYWAIGEIEGLENLLWQNMNRLFTGEGGLGERLHNVYSTLLKRHDFVILIGSDSPQLTPKIIMNAANKINNNYVIGPAHDGGFYLFGGSKPIDRKIWLETPYSKNDTTEILSRKLDQNIEWLEKRTDVDEKSDLPMLINELEGVNLKSQVKLREWIRLNATATST